MCGGHCVCRWRQQQCGSMSRASSLLEMWQHLPRSDKRLTYAAGIIACIGLGNAVSWQGVARGGGAGCCRGPCAGVT